VQQAQPGGALGPRGAARDERGDLVGLAPEHLADVDFLVLALDGNGVEAPAIHLHERLVALHGLERGDDLVPRGHLGQARGEVHRVAEDIAIALDQRAVVQPDARGQAHGADGGEGIQLGLHLERGAAAGAGVGKDTHHFIADRLDDAPAVALGDGGEELHAHVDGRMRGRVANRFVKLCTAAHVSEEYTAFRLFGCHHESPGEVARSLPAARGDFAMKASA